MNRTGNDTCSVCKYINVCVCVCSHTPICLPSAGCMKHLSMRQEVGSHSFYHSAINTFQSFSFLFSPVLKLVFTARVPNSHAFIFHSRVAETFLHRNFSLSFAFMTASLAEIGSDTFISMLSSR